MRVWKGLVPPPTPKDDNSHGKCNGFSSFILCASLAPPPRMNNLAKVPKVAKVPDPMRISDPL